MKNKKETFYTFPDADICMIKIIEYFDFLVKEYDYKIITKEYKKYNTTIIYENKSINKIIKIENHTDYTDYGYSIMVYNTENIDNKSYNIIFNVPYEKQDTECKFIIKSSEYVKREYNNIINSKEWKGKK
jgi:hypothetical protein